MSIYCCWFICCVVRGVCMCWCVWESVCLCVLAKNKIKYVQCTQRNSNTKLVASGAELFISNFRASILELYTHQNVTFSMNVGCGTRKEQWTRTLTTRSNASFVLPRCHMVQKIYLLSSTAYKKLVVGGGDRVFRI